MGDLRYEHPYRRVAEADDRVATIRSLTDEEVISALAASVSGGDPYLANVLASEAMNRVRHKSTIVETAGEGLLSLDAQGAVTYANPAAERVLGWRAEELLGEQVHELVHHHYPDGTPFPAAECPLLRIALTGQPLERFETVFWTREGRPVPVEVTAAPILREGEIEGIVFVFTDITEKRRAEDQRAELLRRDHDARRLLEATARDLGDAVAALQSSEARYSALFRSIGDAILVADVERGIVAANPAFERLTGYSLEDLQGRKTDLLYVNHEDYVNLGATLRAGMATDESLRRVVPWRKHSGESFLAEITAFYVRDTTGKVLGFSAIVRDVTKARRDEARQAEVLRELETERARLEGLFLQAPAAIAIVEGPHHVFRFVNRRYEELVGVSSSQIVGRAAGEAIPQLREQGFVALLDRVRETGEPFYVEGAPVILPRDGALREIYFNFVYQPVQGDTGEVERILGLAVDVTAQVEAQNKLRDLAATLEERVEDRTRRLRRANEDLLRANEALESFSYVISHDLKEPVRAVEAYLEAALEDYGRPSGEEMLRRALEANRRQHALIQGLLAYSRTSASLVDLVPVDLTWVLQEACRGYYEELARERGAAVEVSPLPCVLGHPAILTQLFGNLVLNAVRHNPDGAARVRVSARTTPDGKVEVLIDDNGPGFPPEVKRRINEAEGARPHSIKGGFGLAISHRAAERLGGTLRVSESPEGGGRVHVLLDAA
ncbi:MAG TPA: PAS domain S-box protein [Candidatus Thermoplasmatota archaeon]|nr:PAS domain S-box protein [Candidatus Thermoplasmatota archaeon]